MNNQRSPIIDIWNQKALERAVNTTTPQISPNITSQFVVQKAINGWIVYSGNEVRVFNEWQDAAAWIEENGVAR